MSGIIKIPKAPKTQPTARPKKLVRGKTRHTAYAPTPLTRVRTIGGIRLAQLSDLHLAGAVGTDISYHRFLLVLTLAKKSKANFLLLTGDLVNDGNPDGYDWLFEQLDKVGIDYVAIAGNHDVTHEHNAHLPFEKRTFSPIKADKRLQDCRKIEINDWQILLLNSTIAGQIGGKLSNYQLDWLHTQLADDPSPALIALHHHPVAVGSKWIDEYKLANGTELLTVINQHDNAKILICGHIHQAHDLPFGNATLYTAPAVSRQFLPFSDEFRLDSLPIGFRQISLWSNGEFDSQVRRVNERFVKPETRHGF